MAWTPGMKMEDVEKQVLIEALTFFMGNKTQTAQALGITTQTIRNKIDQFKIQLPCLKNVPNGRDPAERDILCDHCGEIFVTRVPGRLVSCVKCRCMVNTDKQGKVAS